MKEVPDKSEWVRLAEVAKSFGRTRRTVFNWCVSGRNDVNGKRIQLESWFTPLGRVTTRTAVDRFIAKIHS